MQEAGIETFLEGSRRVVPQSEVPNLLSHYAQLYDVAVKGLLSEYGNNLPKLKVVYSDRRCCQMVKWKGCWHLIYDQYLGETFHLLTRVLYHAKSPDYAEAFALKCIIQHLVSRGRLEEASLAATLYTELQPTEPLPKFESGNDRVQVTYLQELFVMAHELCHHTIKHNRVFYALQRCRAELLFADGKQFSIMKIPNETKRRKLGKQYGVPSSQAFWSQTIAEQKQFWDAKKERYLEEIACDVFAFETVIRHALQHSIAIGTSMKAVLLALRYLRILSHCEELAGKFADDNNDSNHGEALKIAQMREHILRATFWSGVDVSLGSHSPGILGLSQDERRSASDELRRLMDRLDTVIYYPIVLRLPRLLNEVKTLRRRLGVSRDSNDAMLSSTYDRRELIAAIDAIVAPNL